MEKILALTLVLSVVLVDNAAVVFMNGGGDSLSVGYNAVRNGLPSSSSGESGVLNCPNGAMSGRGWGSELPNTNCPPTNNPQIQSFASYQYCGPSARSMSVRNDAASGATMMASWKSQANTINGTLTASGLKQVVLFMGHNDICNGGINKVTTNCSNTDNDPNGYCRPYPQAFERAFRDGLESLVSRNNLSIGVLAPARVSQLCKAQNQSMCQAALTGLNPQICGNAWKSRLLGDGICASVTNDCSNARVQDAYNQEKAYRDVLQSVSAEYNSIPAGSRTKTFTFNGKTVGGATKGSNVNIVFSDAIWVTQLLLSDISCCDCFHASVAGQQRLANAAFNGVTCSTSTPCCSDASTALNNGQCTSTVITDGRRYPGVQL